MYENDAWPALLALWPVIFGFLGNYVAKQCGRSPTEGIFLGCAFGRLGAILIALMPRLDTIDVEWQSKILASISAIENDLKWHRTQKEKEIIRAKAAQSKKPPVE